MAEEIRILQLSVSDSRQREKNAMEAEEKLEEYQNRVATMQRMMEERSLVAESKIKKLQTENEALKLHLKLAIESIKNPIPAVTVKAPEADYKNEEDKENATEDGQTADDASEDGEDGEDYDSESTAYDEQYDLQEEMQRYLQDMGNLRKLIGGDMQRFRDEASARLPLGPRENV
jgi:hypothetical protein